MAHMLEDSTYKMEGPPPKKEVSWVLGIYVQNFWAITIYCIYIYIYMICITWHPLFLVKKFIQLKTPSSMILGKTPCYLRSSHGSPPNATPSFVSTKKTSLSLRNKMVMASNYGQRGEKNNSGLWVVVLMEEILHQLIGSLSHYSKSFVHPRWCRISSINS